MLTSTIRSFVSRLRAFDAVRLATFRRMVTSDASAVDSSSEVDAKTAVPFALFQQPRVEVPSFDLYRYVGNKFAQTWYRMCIEKNYTLEGLLDGAIQAALLCSQHLCECNWERLKAIMYEDSVEELRERIGSLRKNEVSKLRFALDDVICSFLHSSCFIGRSFFDVLAPRNYSFCNHVVIYVRKENSISLDDSPGKILKNATPGSLHIINITLVRSLNPVGFWKITKINFFDPNSRISSIDVGLIR